MLTNDIKKGMKIITNQLGTNVSGTMEDNKKGNTSLIKTNGSEVGLFDEFGSIYAWNIVRAKVNNSWYPVELTPKQLEDQRRVSMF